MKINILNISKLKDSINNLNVIGIRDDGNIILVGTKHKIDIFEPSDPFYTSIFYEYNPNTKELKIDILKDSNIIININEIYQADNSKLVSGATFFIEIRDSEYLNIIKYNFNTNIKDVLFSTDFKINSISMIRVVSLTNRYLCLIFKEKTEKYQFIVFDIDERKKYKIRLTEYIEFKYTQMYYKIINNKPYLVIVKNSKPNLKMEYYVHKWEWDQKHIHFKDEQIFLIPFDDFINDRSVNLQKYKIIEVNFEYKLKYLTTNGDNLYFGLINLKSVDNEVKFADQFCTYNIITKNLTKNYIYDLEMSFVSNASDIFIQRKEDEKLVLQSLINLENFYIRWIVKSSATVRVERPE